MLNICENLLKIAQNCSKVLLDVVGEQFLAILSNFELILANYEQVKTANGHYVYPFELGNSILSDNGYLSVGYDSVPYNQIQLRHSYNSKNPQDTPKQLHKEGYIITIHLE